MNSKRVINVKIPCNGIEVSHNRAKNLLAFLVMMASVPVAHVASNKYIILSQGTSTIHDKKCNR